jgi:hypothetical protein
MQQPARGNLHAIIYCLPSLQRLGTLALNALAFVAKNSVHPDSFFGGCEIFLAHILRIRDRHCSSRTTGADAIPCCASANPPKRTARLQSRRVCRPFRSLAHVGLSTDLCRASKAGRRLWPTDHPTRGNRVSPCTSPGVQPSRKER